MLASLIVKELKQSFPTQILAAVIAMTLPVGLLQGSSTQGNLIVAFWLLAFVVFTLTYFRTPTSVGLVCCGLAFGFALLSKGTVYAIIPAVAATLWLCGIVRTTGYRCRTKLVCTGMGVVLVALVVNGGHYTRNWDLWRHPLGPMNKPAHSHVNEQIGVFILMANLIRNAALHWGGPNETLNTLTLDTVRRVFGETIDDIPGGTLGRSLFEVGIPFSLSESHAGNFLHFWFLAASLLGILLFRQRGRFDPWTVGLTLSVVLGALAFCGILQWQQWNNRYHVPLFMLGAPCGAIFVARLLAREEVREKAGPSGSSSVRSLHFCSESDTHVFQQQHQGIASLYSGNRLPCGAESEKIGLHGDTGEYHYPIWVLLKDKLGEVLRLEYVGVRYSAPLKLRESAYTPPFVFSTIGPASTLEEERYYVVWQSQPVTVLATAKAANEVLEGLKKIISPKNHLIRSHLEVYLDRNEKMGNRLVYVKKGSQPAAGLSAQSHPVPAEPPIFLHVIPADKDDLPDNRKQYGFDNLDFHFNDYRIEIQLGERYLAVRNLPAWNVAGIRTGQSTDGGLLWEATVSFNEW